MLAWVGGWVGVWGCVGVRGGGSGCVGSWVRGFVGSWVRGWGGVWVGQWVGEWVGVGFVGVGACAHTCSQRVLSFRMQGRHTLDSARPVKPLSRLRGAQAMGTAPLHLHCKLYACLVSLFAEISAQHGPALSHVASESVAPINMLLTNSSLVSPAHGSASECVSV